MFQKSNLKTIFGQTISPKFPFYIVIIDQIVHLLTLKIGKIKIGLTLFRLVENKGGVKFTKNSQNHINYLLSGLIDKLSAFCQL